MCVCANKYVADTVLLFQAQFRGYKDITAVTKELRCGDNGPFVHPPMLRGNVKQGSKDTDPGKAGLGEKPVPMPLCSPQISRGLN